MSFLDWAATIAGILITLLVLLDLLFVVLHIDSDGIFATAVFRTVWRVAICLGVILPSLRRRLLGVAGPLMLVTLFVLWMIGLCVGPGLIAWPHITDGFHSHASLGDVGFIDALYFSGNTGAVLGYGDITPLTIPMKFLAVTLAIIGFAVLSGTVAHILAIMSAVSQRQALAAQVRVVAGVASDGTESLIRLLKFEGVAAVRNRLLQLLMLLRDSHEKIQHLPTVDLYYRSTYPERDPELMLFNLARLTIAAHVASEKAPELTPVVADLEATQKLIYATMTKAHLPRAPRESPATPTPADDTLVRSIRERLSKPLPDHSIDDLSASGGATAFAAEARQFLDEMDGVTGWKRDHGSVLS